MKIFGSKTPIRLASLSLFMAICSPLGLIAQTSRVPAVPLVTHDPYFSVWSMSDTLTAEPTKHWTGTQQSMLGMIRIDGKVYRFAGVKPFTTFANASVDRDVPAMKQTDLRIFPTRTIYGFEADGVKLKLTFFTPVFTDDLDTFARPVTYVVWEVSSSEDKLHKAELYFDVTGQWVVNSPEQPVTWSHLNLGTVDALQMGTRDQQILQKSGDDLRIDWGYLFVAAAKNPSTQLSVGKNGERRSSFIDSGKIVVADDTEMPRAPLAVPRSSREETMPVMASAFDLGSIGKTPVSRYLMLAYDDRFSIEYLNQKMLPYWRGKYKTAGEMIAAAEKSFPALWEKSVKFDEKLMNELRLAGGEDYAHLAALSYRQTIAAHKLVIRNDGVPYYFPKENNSNGCIATVDVIYPSAPFFLYLNPELLKAQITPVMEYARSGRWRFPFAPHDLGTYPLANGQVYGGGELTEENQMPVEESGNILILMAAIAKRDGNSGYADKYWDLLTRWAQYLKEKGFDPENQLSTDDFAGHLAHNTNLSAKAIIALGSYAMLADMTDRKNVATEYRQTAQDFAKRWEKDAVDGDHYKLAFDKPGSWSQKYNLVWDKLLGLKLFSSDISRKEIAFYKTKQNKYGLPLDNRAEYTKLDWIVWTATLADNREDFETFVKPLTAFMNDSPDRVPLTDWFVTTDAKQRGFKARSVVGGVYIKMLEDKNLSPAK